MFNISRNKISSLSIKVMQVCPRVKCKKCCSLKLNNYHLLSLEELFQPMAQSSSIDRVSVEIYEVQFLRTDFHPIRECMFGLSFLTTLNIYKDYFKGC